MNSGTTDPRCAARELERDLDEMLTRGEIVPAELAIMLHHWRKGPRDSHAMFAELIAATNSSVRLMRRSERRAPRRNLDGTKSGGGH